MKDKDETHTTLFTNDSQYVVTQDEIKAKKIWSKDESDQFTKKIAAMTVGNVMEWYDFAVFGALADIIGDEFFPTDNPSLQLLQSLSVFGAAFLMRPLGGLLIGNIGDTLGRKRALEISIALMLVPSFLMGCLPTYNQIGITSTVLLVMLRLMQGLAVGGELVGAFIYTVEATHGENRGFWGAICKASGSTGTTLGMGFAALLRGLLTDKQMSQWGWRIPFLLGIVFGIIGVWLRTTLNEDDGDEFMEEKKKGHIEKNPTKTVIQSQWREMIIVVMTGAFWGIGYYSCFVWMVYFLSSPTMVGGQGVSYAWELNFGANIALVFVFPLAGMLGDFVGVKVKNENKGFRIVMCMGAGLMLCLAIPGFLLVGTRTIQGVIMAQSFFVLAMSLYGASLPAYMTSLFNTSVRYSGVGIAYNIANAIFSGTAPLVQTFLVMNAKTPQLGRILPAIYLMAVSLFALVGLGILHPCFMARRRALLDSRGGVISSNTNMDTSSSIVMSTIKSPIYSVCMCLDEEDADFYTSSHALTNNHQHHINNGGSLQNSQSNFSNSQGNPVNKNELPVTL